MLDLSRCRGKEHFEHDTKCSAVSFPMLSSVRVLVRERRLTTQDELEVNDSAPEHAISAVIVEATEQKMNGPKASTN